MNIGLRTRFLLQVRLSDSVVAIVHHRGRVFCSLANGRMAVFHRDPQTKEFCENKYREIVISPSPDSHSIRCVAVVLEEFIWCGYRNCMAVINAETLEVNIRRSAFSQLSANSRWSSGRFRAELITHLWIADSDEVQRSSSEGKSGSADGHCRRRSLDYHPNRLHFPTVSCEDSSTPTGACGSPQLRARHERDRLGASVAITPRMRFMSIDRVSLISGCGHRAANQPNDRHREAWLLVRADHLHRHHLQSTVDRYGKRSDSKPSVVLDGARRSPGIICAASYPTEKAEGS